MKTIECLVEHETRGAIGSVMLPKQEAEHFSSTGLHDANLSLNDVEQAALGLNANEENYILIRY